jgi:hypothetical protein
MLASSTSSNDFIANGGFKIGRSGTVDETGAIIDWRHNSARLLLIRKRAAG